jgi:hypothetical protein
MDEKGNRVNIWDLDKLYVFIMFVVPGFVSLKAYDLLFPNLIKDSSKQVIDAVTYSCLNYAFLFFFILKVEKSSLSTTHPNLYFFFYFFVLFISPLIIVFIWKWLRSTNFVQKNAPHPTAKPWDYVFAQRKSYWVKVVLKDGTVIGGRYSNKSFASSTPAPEQIYLEETWVLNENGGFERAKNDTAGVIILSSNISHIEFRN